MKPIRSLASRIRSRFCRMPPARATERARRLKTVSLAAVASVLLLAMIGTSACIVIHTPAVPDDATPIPGWTEDKYQAGKMIAALAERGRRLSGLQSPPVMDDTPGTQPQKAKEDI